MRQLHDDELVADVLCGFGAEDPTAPWFSEGMRGGDWKCGWCAYGKLAEAITGDARQAHLGGSLNVALRDRLLIPPYPGESSLGIMTFNEGQVRAAWGTMTVGTLRAAIEGVATCGAKDWSISALMQEESELVCK